MTKIVDKSCKTCEFNYDGKCVDYYYGSVIEDFDSHRTCWSIGADYFNELLKTLPERTQEEIKRGFKNLNNFYEIN
ncbi:hypothetical protein [Cytobacillus praedii]|uniref:hypothetical protein n=1 Tax=Cytobacillus praedii TaxID=1742358 RepID=UPI002E218761|nr:hypothetical protein [Cytobacillus praedii]